MWAAGYDQSIPHILIPGKGCMKRGYGRWNMELSVYRMNGSSGMLSVDPYTVALT